MEPLKAGSKIQIRSNRTNIAETGNAPYIIVQLGGGPDSAWPSNLIWNDKGSDAAYSVSIYRVQAPDGYFMIGDYAQNNYDPVNGNVPVICAVNDDPDDPLLAAPTAYNMMWSTNGTDSDADGSIWQPVAPTGYVAMGWVAQAGTSLPSISNYMCVRADFVENFRGTAQFIWDDRKSGADMSIALYTPGNDLWYPQLTFTGQSNYDSFSGTIYVFNDRVQVLPQ